MARKERRVIIRTMAKESGKDGFYWVAAFPDEAGIRPGKRRATATIPCIPFEIERGNVCAYAREEMNLSVFQMDTNKVGKAAINVCGVYDAVRNWLEDENTRVVFRQYTVKNNLGVAL